MSRANTPATGLSVNCGSADDFKLTRHVLAACSTDTLRHFSLTYWWPPYELQGYWHYGASFTTFWEGIKTLHPQLSDFTLKTTGCRWLGEGLLGKIADALPKLNALSIIGYNLSGVEVVSVPMSCPPIQNEMRVFRGLIAVHLQAHLIREYFPNLQRLTIGVDSSWFASFDLIEYSPGGLEYDMTFAMLFLEANPQMKQLELEIRDDDVELRWIGSRREGNICHMRHEATNSVSGDARTLGGYRAEWKPRSE